MAETAKILAGLTLEISNQKPCPIKYLHSLERFLQRLETYQNSNFFFMHQLINPNDCARHGLENSEQDLLICEHCRETLSVTIQKNLSQESAKVVASKIIEQFNELHHIFCPWKFNPIPEHMINSIILTIDFKTNFWNKVKHFSQSHSKLPKINFNSQIFESKSGNVILKELHERQNSLIEEDIGKSYLSLSLCGWKWEENVDILSCSFCFRKVGVWNFLQSEKSFDVFSEHRWFCPFKNPLMIEKELELFVGTEGSLSLRHSIAMKSLQRYINPK